MTDAWPRDQIDHANLDRVDNRWGNLREATPRRQRTNAPAPSTNTSGYKGVSRHHTGKWVAHIRINGRPTSPLRHPRAGVCCLRVRRPETLRRLCETCGGQVGSPDRQDHYETGTHWVKYRFPGLHAEKSRHGKLCWYYRIGKGKRIRIRGLFPNAEWATRRRGEEPRRAWRPRRRPKTPFAGSLANTRIPLLGGGLLHQRGQHGRPFFGARSKPRATCRCIKSPNRQSGRP